MAARKSLSHDETARRNIQTSQLINRLTAHANAEIELSPTQVKAIEILLRKSLPDLTAVQHSGEVETHYVAHTPAPAASMDTWQSQFGPPTTVQ